MVNWGGSSSSLRLAALVSFFTTHLARADIVFFDANGTTYTQANLGPIPNQTFISRPDLTASVLNLHNEPGSDVLNKTGFVFFSIGSNMQIFTTDGHPVWIKNVGSDSSVRATDFRVEEYQGLPQLTFSAGVVLPRGFSNGMDEIIMDKTYTVVKNFTTVNAPVKGDLHEYSLTSSGTALISFYPTVEVAPPSGDPIWLVDGCMQEIDIASDTLLFQWCASDHVSLDDGLAPASSAGSGSTEGDAKDWFHINSIDKDDSGNYLISSRHCSALYYIDGANGTGNVIWALGGKSSNWTVSEDAVFHYQHMARWQNGGKQISLWDNANANWNPSDQGPIGRGLLLDLDFESMTASVAHAYLSPRGDSSISQGSYQELAGRQVFLSTGAAPGYIGWYEEDGTLLYYAQLGTGGGAETYRAFYSEWVGTPSTSELAAVLQNDTSTNASTLYVSWNGATEVKTWRVSQVEANSPTAVKSSPKHRYQHEASFRGEYTSRGKSHEVQGVAKRAGEPISVPKTGFETTIDVSDLGGDLEVCGLNGEGESLGCTTVSASV